MNIFIKDILSLCNGQLLIGDDNLVCDSFSKDTRDINGGDIYVGIKGETFDGNLFYEEAFSRGAKACILEHIELSNEEQKQYKDKTIVIVKDSILALQQLASYKRSLYNIPVIAITGSVGKTSTKDMIFSVLSQQYKTLATVGNQNNHIGLPLTILGLKDHNALVLEMGMNNIGEISLLSKIAKPTLAVITNIGTAHIGNLGSRENILKAKLEITEGLVGPLIINNDNDLLHSNLNDLEKEIITIGIDNKSDFQAINICENDFSSNFQVDDNKINVPIIGKPFIYNALMAYAIGKYYNIPIDKIKKGIETIKLSNNRLEKKINKKGISIIDDSYNASLDSIKAALEVLSKTDSKRKILILGDILELGDYSEEIHRKVGQEIIKNNIDILILIGELSKYTKDEVLKHNFKSENIYSFNKEEECHTILDNLLVKGDAVLLKGSHAINLTNTVEYLMK